MIYIRGWAEWSCMNIITVKSTKKLILHNSKALTSWEWERLWLVELSSSSEDSSVSWGSSCPKLGVLPECWLSSNRSPSSVLSKDLRRTPQLKLSMLSPCGEDTDTHMADSGEHYKRSSLVCMLNCCSVRASPGFFLDVCEENVLSNLITLKRWQQQIALKTVDLFVLF